MERLVIRTIEHIKDIQTVECILEDVRLTSSTNDKKAILENNKDNETLKKVLEYTYNPHKKYGVSDMKKVYELTPCDAPAMGSKIWNILDILADNNINDALRQQLRDYLEFFEVIADTLEGIVTKDLRLGVNATTLNKIWKGLIPTSETGVEIKPMLATKFDFTKEPRTDFVVTEKLDGIRCMAVCTQEGVQLYTRQGKLIEGCFEIEEDLMKLRKEIRESFPKLSYKCLTEFVFDGELLATGCSYEEVYKETTKRVKNKNLVKTGIEYKIFDVLHYNQFLENKCTNAYYERLELLTDFSLCMHGLEHISKINVLYMGSSKDRLIELLDEYRNRGAEGLMINYVDGIYEFKRSKNIQKVKVMETVDLEIIGFEEGAGKNAGKLGALIVDYKGCEVGVGSGFTDFDREFIWNNQDQFLGKICEVQYFEETKNKDGGVSLRFPVYKHLRQDKVEPSYY